MSASAALPLAAMEVPIPTGDRMQWIELTVSSTFPQPSQDSAAVTTPAIRRNTASCHVVSGDPPAYLFWRIHGNLPNVLEVVVLIACNEYPETGLRFFFPEELHPFAFLCKNENAGGDAYLLYALTVSGTAYLLNLKTPFKFVSGSIFPSSELIDFSVRSSALDGNITAVVATLGCLVIGRQDGSVSCCQLGVLHPNKPGFMCELRDDAGLGRLWNLMSRGKAAGAVLDMATLEAWNRKLLFVLHSDGSMRIWDLLNWSRVLCHNLSSPELIGTPSRLWVGSADYERAITVAVLFVTDVEAIKFYNICLNVGEKKTWSLEPLLRTVTFDKGRFIDLKISSSKLWIIKEDGSFFYELSSYDYKRERTSNYGLQEDYVADQLFQSSEHCLDDLVWANNSIFSSMKDQIAQFISSIFLRRLLLPGIYQNAALRAVFLVRKKSLSDREFQSMSVADLRKELFKIINSEGSTASSSSLVYNWKDFCTHYFQCWCHDNEPYGLFVDSSNALGLIRKNSFSLFRSLEGIEKLIYGLPDEFHDLKSYGLSLPIGNGDNELLYEVLRCLSQINHQIGRAASAVFYESLLIPSISSEEVVFHLLKILETGYSPLACSPSVQLGVDGTWEKMQATHKRMRKFSVDMLLSLNVLHSKATNWSRVLNVIEIYLEYLKPHRNSQKSCFEANYSCNSVLLVQATSQVARVMFETAFDILLLLGYLINASGKVSLVHADVTRLKVSLMPVTREILTHWLVVHFAATTPTNPSVVDDFSSRLSSLHIGSNSDKRSWHGKLGSPGFTLACLFDFPFLSEGDHNILKSFPSSDKIIQYVFKLSSLFVWGVACEVSSNTSIQTNDLVSVLLWHGQYEAAENLFLIIDNYTSSRNLSLSSWHADADWFRRLHLLGFCLIMRAHTEVDVVIKEKKVHEAVRCFFRVGSLPDAAKSLQNLPLESGFEYSGEFENTALWRLHYYQWVMQVFDQYAISEGAYQFAFAALEQIDEIFGLKDGGMDDELLPEPASAIRGRLWANVFKFALDLKNYRDAYCAIISNPDEDNKCICLRRFVIVLCEDGATKGLCDGKLPFIGMTEKIEQELFWKAERSDIFARPNLYKLLYSFEAYRNNWRKAASYIYRYSMRLRNETNKDDSKKYFVVLQERLEGLSAAINALQLVCHASAWIEAKYEDSFSTVQGLPNKRSRNVPTEKSFLSVDLQSERLQFNIDIEMLEKEYVLTSAQYLLSNAKDRFKFSGNQKLSNLVSVLIDESFFDMAFTVILKFWKGSALNRELEQAFIILAEKCLTGENLSSPLVLKANSFLLSSPEDIAHVDGRINSSFLTNQIKRSGHWETIELYLEKYRKLHQRLPVVVAETLLYVDPQIVLPFWLVNMFKVGQRTISWGMTGQQPDPATLFRLYLDYGRLAEATNLVLDYLKSFASLRTADVVNRKKMSAIWFPYTAIERLWCQLVDCWNSGHMTEQCDKLKRLLQGALLNYIKEVKMDSEDAVAAAAGQIILT